MFFEFILNFLLLPQTFSKLLKYNYNEYAKKVQKIIIINKSSSLKLILADYYKKLKINVYVVLCRKEKI